MRPTSNQPFAGKRDNARSPASAENAQNPDAAIVRDELPNTGQRQVAERSSVLAEIGYIFQSALAGSTLSEGLRDLVDRFKAAGQSVYAESWVADGPNMTMDVDDLERTLGNETLDDQIQKTGLPRASLHLRIYAARSDAVN